MAQRLKGTFWALLLYDVSEEIRLNVARDLLGAVPHPSMYDSQTRP